MVITNYSFFSSILNEKLFSPSRWYISDGTDYPLEGNKYFSNYKNLLINLIKKNQISVIYIIYPQKDSIIFKYLDRKSSDFFVIIFLFFIFSPYLFIRIIIICSLIKPLSNIEKR